MSCYTPERVQRSCCWHLSMCSLRRRRRNCDDSDENSTQKREKRKEKSPLDFSLQCLIWNLIIVPIFWRLASSTSSSSCRTQVFHFKMSVYDLISLSISPLEIYLLSHSRHWFWYQGCSSTPWAVYVSFAYHEIASWNDFHQCLGGQKIQMQIAILCLIKMPHQRLVM